MNKPKPEHADDGARMTQARSRLEQLLADAGPEIRVTPVGDGNGRPGTPQAERGRPSSTQGHQARPITSNQAPAAAPSRRASKLSPASAGAAKQDQRTQSAPLPTGGEPVRARATDVGNRGQVASDETRRIQPDLRGAKPNQRRAVRPAAPAQAQSHSPIEPPSVPAGPATGVEQASRVTTQTEERQQAPRIGSGSELTEAIHASRQAFIAAGVFSCVINILMLAGPLFMLQVYDRVMTSGSVPTLVALTVLTAGVYGVIGLLELVRSRVVVRIGLEVDGRISKRVFDAALKSSIAGRGHSTSALRELDTMRQFIASSGPLTFFDAPWTPIYLLVIFMLHWTLGVAATIGAVILIAIAWFSESRSRDPLLNAGRTAARSIEIAETGQRNAEAIAAMGMTSAYRSHWQRSNGETLGWQLLAADRLGGMTAISKSMRLLMQSLMLAVGAALALEGLISAGAIVAGTIIFGRALAPVEQAIGHWRQFLKARESYAKLDNLLAAIPPSARKTALPKPKGVLEVQQLRVAAPETRQLILAQISFYVRPGQMLAVIGPSASGKSSLVRALVGLWEPHSGSITLDGARLDQWDAEELGQYIGYLPQSVELFAGSVRENIARFQSNATDEEVVAAAKQAHAHELILALPKGYDTELGAYGTYLSGGQKQRIALARALFRDPPLVVLDEPNANLDRLGDVALAAAIDGMRERGQSVVLVSHRVQAIGKADLIVYLERGVQRAFGPRDDVLRHIQGGAVSAQPVARQDVSGEQTP